MQINSLIVSSSDNPQESKFNWWLKLQNRVLTDGKPLHAKPLPEIWRYMIRMSIVFCVHVYAKIIIHHSPI